MTDDELNERLRATCVLITRLDGGHGSGFLVARGIAATAEHVIRDRQDGETFTVQVGWGPGVRRDARATLLRRDTRQDAAILKLDGCDDIAPLPVMSVLTGRPAWFGFGFPRVAARNGKATGIPFDGQVADHGWFNANDVSQVILDHRGNAGDASIVGVSGSAAVTADGIFGVIVEEFRDPGNPEKGVLGKMKACPIRFVLDMLPPDAVYAMAPEPWHGPAAALAGTRQINMPDIFSWCDREGVVSRINAWMEREGAGNVGLLCLVGHTDNRPKLLVQRIARELSVQESNPVPTSCVTVRECAPGDDNDFRRAILDSLSIKGDAPVEESTKFRSAAGLLLACHCCDLAGWSLQHLQRRLLHVAQWLDSVRLARSRLVVVLVVRYVKPPWFFAPEKRVRTACDRVTKEFPRLRGMLLDAPLHLADYVPQNVLDWAEKPIVIESMGDIAARIDSTVVSGWFRKKSTASHGALLPQLIEFHKQRRKEEDSDGTRHQR